MSSSNGENSSSLVDSSSVAFSVPVSICASCQPLEHAGTGKPSKWGNGEVADG